MMASVFAVLLGLLVPAVKAYEDFHISGFPRTEFEVLRYLFSDPWRKYKAAFNDNGTAMVDLQLSLNRIISLDTEAQVLTIDAWINVQYNDKSLSWNPLRFGDIKTVRVPSDKIWKPDILLYNNAGMTNGYTAEVMAVLTYDGTIFYVQPVQLQSYCKTPKFGQTDSTITCSLKFGSWTHDGLSLDLNLAYGHTGVDLSNYDGEFNREWQVNTTSATKNVMVYQCCPEPYIDLLYSIELQRKSP